MGDSNLFDKETEIKIEFEMIGNVKHIVVFQSLPANEKQTGQELYDDCIRRHIDYLQDDAQKMVHNIYDIQDKEQFIELIKYYEANAEYMNNGLLFHFEMHGDENQGLLLKSGEYISWSELITLFRPINIKTENRLFITMATCFGRFLYKGVSAYEKSPYSGYISASQEVTVGDILEDFDILFENLIRCGNIVQAYQELEKSKTLFFYKDMETTFEEAFKYTIWKCKNDPEYFKNGTLAEFEKVLGRKATDKEYDQIFNQVVQDLYNKQKGAFNFNN